MKIQHSVSLVTNLLDNPLDFHLGLIRGYISYNLVTMHALSYVAIAIYLTNALKYYNAYINNCNS